MWTRLPTQPQQYSKHRDFPKICAAKFETFTSPCFTLSVQQLFCHIPILLEESRDCNRADTSLEDPTPKQRLPISAFRLFPVYCGGGASDGGTGFPFAVSGSISSIRVPSGSKRLACRLPLTPVLISIFCPYSL